MGKVFWSGALVGRRRDSGAAARSRTQGVHPARATLVRHRPGGVRLSPRARSRRRVRADPARRPRRQARRRGGLDRRARPPAGSRRAARRPLSRGAGARSIGRSGVRRDPRPRPGCAHGRGRARVRVEQLRRRGGLRTRRARPRRRGLARPPTPALPAGEGRVVCGGRRARHPARGGSGVRGLRGRRTRSRSPRPARARWVPGRPRGRSRRTVGACNGARRGRAGDPREGHGVELSRSLRLSRRSLPGSTRAWRGGSGDGRGLGGGRDPRRGAALRRRREVRARSTFGTRRHARERGGREVHQRRCADHALVQQPRRSSSGKTATCGSRSTCRTKVSRWRSASACVRPSSSCEAASPFQLYELGRWDEALRSRGGVPRRQHASGQSDHGPTRAGAHPARPRRSCGRARRHRARRRGSARVDGRAPQVPGARRARVRAGVDGRTRSRARSSPRDRCFSSGDLERGRVRRRSPRTVDVGAGRTDRRHARGDGHRPAHAVARRGRSGRRPAIGVAPPRSTRSAAP